MSHKDNKKKDNQTDNKKRDNNYYLSFGIGFGLIGGSLFATIIGSVFGLIGDSSFPMVMAFSPAIGMIVGIVVGAIMDSNKNKK
jgi:F0F1-type ATP synthase assembly protein I